MGLLRLVEIVREAGPSPVSLPFVTLCFEDRRKSRQLVTLSDGQEAALMLPRGSVLRDGDLLRSDEGQLVVTVRAAPEALSVARTDDPHLLVRAAYHLGNRHVPLQIGPDWLAYQHDHVLDGLARELGLAVGVRSVPFEPEAGGYRHDGLGQVHGGHGHAHGDAAPVPHTHQHAGHHHHHDHDHANDAGDDDAGREPQDLPRGPGRGGGGQSN